MAPKKKPVARKAAPAKKAVPAKKRAAAKPARTAKAPEQRPLNDQQVLFVSEYLKDRNASKAAIRAGYSEKTAAQIGYQQLHNPSVRAAIDEGLERLLADNGLTAERVLKEMARLAFFDPAKLYGKDGRLLSITELDADTRAALTGVEIEGTRTGKAGETARLKWADKAPVLRMAAQHHGLLKEHVELTGKDGGPIEVREMSDAERAVRLASLLARAASRKGGK